MIYLDNAATTYPKPKALLRSALEAYLELGVSPGRGSYDAALEVALLIKKIREKTARFFHAADPERVIFTANATDSLNLAIMGLVKPGDHVITSCLEHNSVLRPLHHLREKHGVSLTFLPFDREGVLDPQDVRTAIGKKTRLVVLTHASNVLGAIQPVAAVGRICREHGVKFLVDASQSAGRCDVNMEEMSADALAFTGHKSLYAPTGIGGLLLDPALDIAATRFGGTGSRSEDLNQPEKFPARLEAGTHNVLGIFSLGCALDFLSEQGIPAVEEHEQRLFQRLHAGLAALNGIELYSANRRANVGILSCNIAGADPDDVGAILDGDYAIAVRIGLHCAPLAHRQLGTLTRGAVRFSPGLFNTEEEIDAAIAAMAEIVRHYHS